MHASWLDVAACKLRELKAALDGADVTVRASGPSVFVEGKPELIDHLVFNGILSEDEEEDEDDPEYADEEDEDACLQHADEEDLD